MPWYSPAVHQALQLHAQQRLHRSEDAAARLQFPEQSKSGKRFDEPEQPNADVQDHLTVLQCRSVTLFFSILDFFKLLLSYSFKLVRSIEAEHQKDRLETCELALSKSNHVQFHWRCRTPFIFSVWCTITMCSHLNANRGV
eukprot:5486971-Amphidinium_carterae.2